MTVVEYENWLIWLQARIPKEPKYNMTNWIRLPKQEKYSLYRERKRLSRTKQ